MTATKSNYTQQITMIGILFFVFGLVTWLNGILIPFLKLSCQLTDQQAFYVATAFFAAYFFLALPASEILKRFGTKQGMSIGLVVMAIGSLIFIPAAQNRSFPLFLTGLFGQGMGLALLQTAANPYVSVIGPIESAARRISIMGICNKLAGILGNLVFGAILLKNADKMEAQINAATDVIAKNQLLDQLASRIFLPYAGLALLLSLMAVWINRSSLPNITEQVSENDNALSDEKKSLTQYPHVWLGALAIFFYVGAEVMAGDLITVYGKNLGFTGDQSKYFTSFGLIGLLLGYVASIFLIPRYVKQEMWLLISTLLGMLLTVASYLTTGEMTITCLAALGFANAVMWPAIFPLGIHGLGKLTDRGSALLIMGIVGGALIPPFYGWLYGQAGLGLDFRSAFLAIMLVCYAYILWFALVGHRIGKKNN
jgi:FHS family L-fucose permease-like MFS transporter